eukprot:TRINITY_DN2046_c0_g1_i1.p1 TRINITY_DN2046_c0_g1~~TRINITY_DN2046_c0_g1_i1.p1  ORF type:complete len:912 (+),score=155.60 TRINITY_DN2046_c0_g1_i1:378-2738(+)
MSLVAQAEAVFHQFSTTPQPHNSIPYIAILRLYRTHNQQSSFLSFLESIRDRSITLNSRFLAEVLSGLCHFGMFEQAWTLFCSHPSLASHLSVTNVLLDAFLRSENSQLLESLLQHASFQNTLPSHETLHIWLRHNRLEEARAVLNKNPSTSCWKVWLDHLSARDPMEALQQFEHAAKHKLSLSVSCIHSLLSVLFDSAQFEPAFRLVRLATSAGMALDATCYYLILKHLLHYSHAAWAPHWLRQMQEKKVALLSAHWQDLLDAAFDRSEIHMVTLLFEAMIQSQVSISRHLYQRILSRLAPLSLDDALDFVKRMNQLGLPPNTNAWAILFRGYLLYGHYAAASQCLGHLTHETLSLGQHSKFLQALIESSCQSVATLPTALALLQAIQHMQLPLSLHSWNNVLSACFQTRQPHFAEWVWSQMQANGVVPDQRTWLILLDGYLQAGMLQHAAHVLNHLPNHVPPNHPVLCQIISEALVQSHISPSPSSPSPTAPSPSSPSLSSPISPSLSSPISPSSVATLPPPPSPRKSLLHVLQQHPTLRDMGFLFPLLLAGHLSNSAWRDSSSLVQRALWKASMFSPTRGSGSARSDTAATAALDTGNNDPFVGENVPRFQITQIEFPDQESQSPSLLLNLHRASEPLSEAMIRFYLPLLVASYFHFSETEKTHAQVASSEPGSRKPVMPIVRRAGASWPQLKTRLDPAQQKLFEHAARRQLDVVLGVGRGKHSVIQGYSLVRMSSTRLIRSLSQTHWDGVPANAILASPSMLRLNGKYLALLNVSSSLMKLL